MDTIIIILFVIDLLNWRNKLKVFTTFYTVDFSDTAILLEGIRTKFDSILDRRGALMSDSQPSTLTGTHLETNLLGLMNMRIINPNDAESTVKVYVCMKNGVILTIEDRYF